MPRRSRLSFLVVCVLGLSRVNSAEHHSLSADNAAAVDRIVEAQMDRQQAVGVAVGVVRDGEIVYLKGYGLADREKRLPVTTESVFNWASNSKPMAAVLAMQLVEKGMLDLDADVRSYVPEFPDKGATITTRQLLCHQSGIPHYKNGAVIPSASKHLTQEAWLDPVVGLSKFDRSPLLFSSGEKTSYSSYAYVLLSAVIDRAGKQRYAEQVQERVACPLNMKSLQLDMAGDGQPNWVTGYEKNLAGKTVITKETAHYWKHGAGGYESNISDFARWTKGLLDHRLVNAETERQMWTLQPTRDGKPAEYGLGFRLKKVGDKLEVSHGGQQDETTTHLVIYPNEALGMVVMSNCDYGQPAAIAAEIASELR
jgi:CubicO group peptidase (beta-lactamase class C family)